MVCEQEADCVRWSVAYCRKYNGCSSLLLSDSILHQVKLLRHGHVMLLTESSWMILWKLCQQLLLSLFHQSTSM